MPGADTTSGPFETAYVWQIASDKLEWEANAASVLAGTDDLHATTTGEEFTARIAPEHQAAWRSAILGARATGAAPDGVAYRVQFPIDSGDCETRTRIWLETSGRWWPDSNGRPIRAEGILRRVDTDHLEARHLLAYIPGDEVREGLNRMRLFEALGVHAKQTRHLGRPCGLLMISANGLDAINARLGPDVGDELISAIGHLIKAKLDKTDLIVRYTSNTFAVVLTGCDVAQLASMGERLIADVEAAKIETSSGPLKAAIAIGAAALPEHAKTGADAVARARMALERAKRAQRSLCVIHSANDQNERPKERPLISEVVAAIEEGRLLLALQPIVDASSRQTAFYEALLRLKRRDGALIAAADFVEEAEQLGLAPLLDRRALELALTLLTAHPSLRLSLNVSSLTAAGDKDWIRTLRADALLHPGLAKRLTVEITETAMIQDLEAVRAFIQLLRKEGCLVAIDDFGTGYTSFRHLKALPVDMLKIDGVFMRDLPNDDQGRIIVSSMITMAKGLGIETVAEWVSDEETALVLAASGVSYLQGFLYGAPKLPEELALQDLL